MLRRVMDFKRFFGWSSVAGSCEHGSKHFGPINVGQFLTSWATTSFSKMTLLPRNNLCNVNWAGKMIMSVSSLGISIEKPWPI
jgi:hypothetical protein